MGAKVADLNHVHPCPCLFVATVRSQHLGWPYHFEHGYICYSTGATTKRMEHRLVAALAHGAIPIGFHVHHQDGNRVNNVADNLAIVSPSEHLRIHRPAQRVTFACVVCGHSFERRESHAERHPRYCSWPCAHLGNRKVQQRPTKEELVDLLSTLRNWCTVGRMFGVSDNAVRNWARHYDLDLSIVDGRRK